MKKKGYILGFTAVFTAMAAMTAFGGQWVQETSRPGNANGRSNWWFKNDDGSYLSNGWFWLDGDGDGLAESYRFDENGWMFVGTSVDGYLVDGSGAWVENGVVPRKRVTPSGKKQKPEKDDSDENEKGSHAPGWKKINGKTYCFDEDGEMLTGYQEVDGADYYFFSNGRLATKTVHDEDEGVYYVIDKKDHFIVDVVDEDDWAEYKREADRSQVNVTSVTNTSGNQDNDDRQDNNGRNDDDDRDDDDRDDDDRDDDDDEKTSSLTDEEAYKKIIALKKSYPEGMRWTNENRHDRSSNWSGYGCAGFAFLVQEHTFGKGMSWEIEDSFDWDSLRVGDHIRMHNGSGGEHSVIVLSIEKDYITITEGNYNSSIHWGRIISRDKLEEEFIYRETCYED